MTNDETKTDVPKPDMIEMEKYLRLAADFDNYKRRIEGEMTEVARFGGQAVILRMVDVLDSLEQAIAHAPPDAPPEWLTGLRRVGNQFVTTMESYGVKRIAVSGQSFNPTTMEAVGMAGGGESHMVKQEVRAGYTLHDRVIRPARVIIYQ
jgi:molecular chaperone GrpE